VKGKVGHKLKKNTYKITGITCSIKVSHLKSKTKKAGKIPAL